MLEDSVKNKYLHNITFNKLSCFFYDSSLCNLEENFLSKCDYSNSLYFACSCYNKLLPFLYKEMESNPFALALS